MRTGTHPPSIPSASRCLRRKWPAPRERRRPPPRRSRRRTPPGGGPTPVSGQCPSGYTLDDHGTNGTNGGVLGYAHDTSGALDTTNSKNFALLSAAFGSYCLQFTAGTPHNAVATIDVARANIGDTVGVDLDPASIAAVGCPAGTNVYVETVHGGVLAPEGFYLAIIA